MNSQPFRILSLDGGGIKGAFTASALATFERATGRRIVEHFDLITGTSTGGIIAIGLAMGAAAEEIGRFYEVEGPKIFSDEGRDHEMDRAAEGRLPAEVLERGPARGHRRGGRGPVPEGGEDEAGNSLV